MVNVSDDEVKRPTRISDEETFERVLESSETVLVEFTAYWSDRCDSLTEPVRERAREANCPVAVVDVERCPYLASCFDVDTLPTVLLFADGQVVDRSTGFPDIDVRSDPSTG